eukprot:s4088_g4.t1
MWCSRPTVRSSSRLVLGRLSSNATALPINACSTQPQEWSLAARPAMGDDTDPEENDTEAGENVTANRSLGVDSGVAPLDRLDFRSNLTMNAVEDNDTEADENGSVHGSNVTSDDPAWLEQAAGGNGSNMTEDSENRMWQGLWNEPSVNVDPAGLEIWLTNKTHKHVKLPPLPVDPMTGTFSFVAESDTIYTITSLSLNDTIFRSEPAQARKKGLKGKAASGPPPSGGARSQRRSRGLGGMASVRNDALHKRVVEGSYNFYDNHQGCGTAADKALAARLGGHSALAQSANA